MRRPLAITCVVLSALLFLLRGYEKSYEPPDTALDSAGNITIQGTVRNKEIKNDQRIVYLENVTVSNRTYSQDSDKEQLNRKLKCRGAICYLDGVSMPKIGSVIAITGKYGEFRRATNKGEFDMAEYYRELGYDFPVYNCILVAHSKNYSYVRERLYDLREYCDYVFHRIYNPSDASVLSAMVLGKKGDINSEIKELYQKNGISHILAISGLHISIIGVFLYTFLRNIAVVMEVRTVLAGVVMVIYGVMTGMGPSTMRAVTMFVILMASYEVRRTYDLVTALALGMLVMTMLNPRILCYSGFWLSYMAVFGIAVFAKAFKLDRKWEHKRVGALVDAILSSMAVSYFTLPLILLFYFEYPLYSVFLNVMILPLMPVLLAGGIITLILGIIMINIGIKATIVYEIVATPCHMVLKVYEVLCKFIERLPLNKLVLGKPPIGCVLLFYSLCLIIYGMDKHMRKRREREAEIEEAIGTRQRQLVFVNQYWMPLKIILFGCLILLLIPNKSGLTITMVDVGQGDGLCIQYDGRVIMVDGGSSSNKELAKYQLIPFLKSEGISHVDYWFISHPDSDHCNGLLQMLESDKDIDVETILLPGAKNIYEDGKDIIAAAEKRGIKVQLVSRGDELRIEELSLTVESPSKDYDTEDPNGYSEILLLAYKDFSMLFTGDANLESEELLTHRPKVNILKVGHHGSNTSTGDEFLKSIDPEVALISAGRNNRYGHPHKDVIDRLTSNNTKIYNTQKNGMIKILVEGGGYKILCYN